MREGRGGTVWFKLLAIGLLVCSLALVGCEGDDGSDGRDGEDFQLSQGEVVGLVNCSTCHGSSTAAADWLESAHANQGSHTLSSCALTCHNPSDASFEITDAFGVSPVGYVVGCEDCHGGGSGHIGVGPIPVPEPGTDVCGQCHSGAQHAERHIFASEITPRFETSRHADRGARTGFCSACHSHEGGVELLAMGRMTSTVDLDAAYNEATAQAYLLPVGSETIDGVTKKSCTTCHDSHKAALRGDGDVLATPAVVTDFPATGAIQPETGGQAEERVAYSAEFNLCTACHMVDLDATWDATAGYDGRGMIRYELSDAYAAANLVDAGTSTFAMVTLENAGRDVFDTAFYHDGASGNGRTFVDTHFSGDTISQLVNFPTDASGADVAMVAGYNVNPGNKNACTICHDPHTAGKMLSIDSSSTIDYADQLDNAAVGYAEGLGEFHTDYIGDAFSRNQRTASCQPCHTGDAFAHQVVRGVEQDVERWNVVGCRSCHDLAVPNAAPGSNTPAAFAEVRQFPADYAFAFNSGAPVDVADLGVNQICFECHKGRTGYDPATFDAAPATGEYQGYAVSYLHYAPSMAILFGAESEMVPTYPGKTYAGKFVHPFAADGAGVATEFGCTDCHDVHNTSGNMVVDNKMANPAFTCNGCHGPGTFADAEGLATRTEVFGERLLETLVPLMESFDATVFTATALNDAIDALVAEPTLAGDLAILDLYIHGRTVYFPNKDIAKAANIYKIFNYEDGSPHGVTHGHGGSWAHNSAFARQVQYDAIEAMGGDLSGLPAAPGRTTVPAPL